MTREKTLNAVVSTLESFEGITHDVALYGNLNLSVGQTVQLNLQRSIDPQVETKGSRLGKAEFDSYLSGVYTVTSLQHSFGEDYTMLLRVKKVQ